MRLMDRIVSTRPESGELAVFYLAQAGFYFKTAAGKTVCIDPYLGDCCESLFNFKRMVPAPMAMDELKTEILVATHSHNDHLDPDLIDCVKRYPETCFIGSPDCRSVYRSAGIDDERVTILAAGESAALNGVEFRAVYADHGELAPDAVGFLINLDGIRVYDTGDTAFCPERLIASLGTVKVDIMITPINSAYGNLGHENAVSLAALIQPRVLIGSHFGMFIEHGGDPGAFLAYAQQSLPETVTAIVMAPCEKMIYSQKQGIREMETQKQG